MVMRRMRYMKHISVQSFDDDIIYRMNLSSKICIKYQTIYAMEACSFGTQSFREKKGFRN